MLRIFCQTIFTLQFTDVAQETATYFSVLLKAWEKKHPKVGESVLYNVRFLPPNA